MPPVHWTEGRVHVYTGDGKGKTTAALGLALRAAGAGLSVYIAQFVKGLPYSEHATLARLDDCITCAQFGRAGFIHDQPAQADIDAARAGLAEVSGILRRGAHDLVVLDEASIATHFGLFSAEELWQAVAHRAAGVEVVITGRAADPLVLERADLVTEMREVRHYYAGEGLEARAGIEM